MDQQRPVGACSRSDGVCRPQRSTLAPLVSRSRRRPRSRRRRSCFAGDRQTATLTLPVGVPAITSLRVDPALAPDGGPAVVDWTAFGAGDDVACTLARGGTPLTTGGDDGSFALDVTCDARDDGVCATFELTCVIDGAPYVRSVDLRARVGVRKTQLAPFSSDGVFLTIRSVGLGVCFGELVSADGELRLPVGGLDPNGPNLLFFPFATAGDAVLEAVCGGREGFDFIVVDIPAPDVARIDTFTANPPALPAGGGEVDFCWSATLDQGCTLTVGNEQPLIVGAAACERAALTATSNARLDCAGRFGGSARDLFVPVGVAITSFAAPPLVTPRAGFPGAASWAAAGATSCMLTMNSVPVSGAPRSTSADDVAFDYVEDGALTLTCVDGGGGGSDVCTIDTAIGLHATLDAEALGIDVLLIHTQAFSADTCVLTVEDAADSQTYFPGFVDTQLPHNCGVTGAPNDRCGLVENRLFFPFGQGRGHDAIVTLRCFAGIDDEVLQTTVENACGNGAIDENEACDDADPAVCSVICRVPAPAGWTCPAERFDDAREFCDCGCGVTDDDCADTTADVCEAVFCATAPDPVDNAVCLPG